jgi:hypothetical protein
MTTPFTSYVRVLSDQASKWDDYWVQVYDFWLVISKKLSGPGHFILLLDLVALRSGEPETHIQNCIYLETSLESGGHKLYLSTISRIDIIQLYQVLDLGWTFFKSTFESGKFGEDAMCEYLVATGFMNLSRERRKLTSRGDSLIVDDSKRYPLHSIISMTPRQGDQNCGTKLLVTIQTHDGTQQKEFSGLVTTEMMRMYSSLLMQVKALAGGRSLRHE